MKPQNLSINSEVFDDLRLKFDYVLTLALARMQRMGIHEGKVSAQVDIETMEQETEEGVSWIPEFKCQVTMSLPLKGKIAAGVPGGLRMVKNPNGEGFIIATDQYSFFDMLEERDEGAEK